MLTAFIAYVSDSVVVDGGGFGDFDWLSSLYFASIVLVAMLAPRTWWWASPLALFWPLGFWFTVWLLP